MKEVHFFKRADGGSPVEEFIEGLTEKQAQKVAWALKLIEDMDVIPAQLLEEVDEYRRNLGGRNTVWR